MSGNQNTKIIYLCVLLSVLFSFCGLCTGFMMMAAFFTLPMLISFIFYKTSHWEALYCVLAVAIFNILTSFALNIHSPIGVLIYSLLTSLPGFLVGASFKRNLSFKHTMLFLLGFDLAVISISLAFLKYYLNINIFSEIKSVTLEAYDLTTTFLKHYQNEYGLTELPDKLEFMSIFYTIIPGLVPFGLILSSMFTSLIKYFLCKKICRRALIQNTSFFDGADGFKVTAVTNIFFVISLLIYFVNINNTLSMICINILLIISTLYIFESISIITYKIRQKVLSGVRSGFLVVLIIFATFIVSIYIPVINPFYVGILVGFLDSLFDFRKLDYNKGEINEKR